MNIHEYQGKELFKARGIPVLGGGIATTPEAAVEVAKGLNSKVYVVKAQIHAGGRGKGGGVKLAKSLDEVRQFADEILGMQLVTPQTTAEGQKVKTIYVEEGCDIDRELYLGMLVDRATSRVTIMASTEGGMEIEEVAEHSPEKILKVTVDPATGILPFHARKLAFGLGLTKDQVKNAVKVIMTMYNAFIELDCSIVEINPLVVTKSGEVIPLDAKVNFDENALFRHKDIEALRDEDEEDPTERKANDLDLAYVKLDGNIGCMVNGAGLAMATMDIIKLYGGEPANFLDVGGGASKEKVTAAFKLIMTDPNVEGILVNIFGGIMRCDVIAEGVIAATKEMGLTIPLVVRLAGTNVEKGKEILSKSGLNIIPADNLADAADKIVNASQRKAA